MLSDENLQAIIDGAERGYIYASQLWEGVDCSDRQSLKLCAEIARELLELRKRIAEFESHSKHLKGADL